MKIGNNSSTITIAAVLIILAVVFASYQSGSRSEPLGLATNDASQAAGSDVNLLAVKNLTFSIGGNVVASDLNGSKLAVATGYGTTNYTVSVWDVSTGRLVKNLKSFTAIVKAVSWSPDGKRLAVGLSDKTIRVLNVSTGAELAKLAGHAGAVISLSWDYDLATGNTSRLASGSSDKTIRIWNASSYRLLKVIGRSGSGPGGFESIAFGYSTDMLAAANNTFANNVWRGKIQVFNVSNKAVMLELNDTNKIKQVSWRFGNTKLLSVSYNTSTIWNVWSVKNLVPYTYLGFNVSSEFGKNVSLGTLIGGIIEPMYGNRVALLSSSNRSVYVYSIKWVGNSATWVLMTLPQVFLPSNIFFYSARRGPGLDLISITANGNVSDWELQ